MNNRLRISHLSAMGQFINFVRQHSLLFFLLLSFVTLISAKSSKSLNNNVHSIVVEIAAPAFTVLKSPFTLFFNVKDNLIDLSHIRAENKILAEDNALLRERLFDLLYLREENLILKDLLNYEEEGKSDFLTSRVYINTYNPFAKLAVIDKGTSDGVSKGQAIVTTKGLVGRILKTSANNSHVLLVTDYQSRVPIYTSESREKAIMIGRSEKFPVLEYLRKDHQAASNEIVYSSGDGLVYPANIPIGTTIRNAEGEIEVIPFIDFNRLDIVKILFY